MRTSGARISRVPSASSARRWLALACSLATLLACSPDPEVDRERDELAAISDPLLPKAVVGCEIAVSMRTLSWTWRWDWNPTSRTLKTTGDNPWTLRYDRMGRLISDERPADKLRMEYAYEPNALVSRRVLRDGKLEENLSFDQRVSEMSTQRIVESRGRTRSGRERIERVAYDDLGFSVEATENGTGVDLVYESTGRWLTATRENGSKVSCTYAQGTQLAVCREDGTFNPLYPSEGTAADGTVDVEWRFSPACAALYPIATVPWLSLPVVAPLSDCLRNTPPHRAPDRCPSFYVKWRSNAPQLVTGKNTAVTQAGSKREMCEDSPCWVQRGDGFQFTTMDRPATFRCVDAEGNPHDSEEPTTEFVLEHITSDWTCEVDAAPYEIRWTSANPEWVSALRPPHRDAKNFVEGLASALCARSPCLVPPRANVVVSSTVGEAHFVCVEANTGETIDKTTARLPIENVKNDWDCDVSFPPFSVAWEVSGPGSVAGWHFLPGGQPERCASSPCWVPRGKSFAFTTGGKQAAEFACTSASRATTPVAFTDEHPLGRLTESWGCTVRFRSPAVPAPPARHTVTFSPQGALVGVPLASSGSCNAQSCNVEAGSDVRWSLREGWASCTCVSERPGDRDEFWEDCSTPVLRNIRDNWTCTMHWFR